MIRAPLVRHPDFPSAVDGIDATLARTGPRRLTLRFFVHGPMRTIALPRWRGGGGERRDGLWQATCFEAFVRAEGAADYYEFNFSPSRDWAAYRFSGYRDGMEAAPVGVSEVGWEQCLPYVAGQHHSTEEHRAYGRNNGWQAASIDLGHAADLPLDRPWRVGLSAVIEERNGRKSFWALAHPPGKPDFHHEACFALELPAARPA